MKKRFWDLLPTVFVLAIIAFAITIGPITMYVTCKARWSDSGMASSWGPIQGCKVQLPSGRWVPDDRVRETDLNSR